MAYIDSQLRQDNPAAQVPSVKGYEHGSRSLEISQIREQIGATSPSNTSNSNLGPTATPSTTASTNPYHLSEVTLPPPAPPAPPPRPKVKKPRLGRDGKPLPPRKPRQRPSEDIARDALVEKLLHENTGTMPEQRQNPANLGSSDVRRDEEFAAKFRAEFMSQAQQEESRRAAASKTAGATGKAAGAGGSSASGASAGPKLGGSRVDRARMQQSESNAK
jgi:hypothetical protein